MAAFRPYPESRPKVFQNSCLIYNKVTGTPTHFVSAQFRIRLAAWNLAGSFPPQMSRWIP